MKPKPFEIIVEFTPQSTKTGITYEAHQKGSLIRCNDCKYNDAQQWVDCPLIPQMFGKTADNNFCSQAEPNVAERELNYENRT